jgi:Rod binding domain-containing protein
MRVLDPSILSSTLEKTAATTPADKPGAPSQETIHAAKEFEQIFLRKMLSSLEKTGRAQGEGTASAGSDVYSSMVVNALSEAISAGGGVGLADMIARSMTPSTAQAASAPQLASPSHVPLNAALHPDLALGAPAPQPGTPVADVPTSAASISISKSITRASAFGSLRPRR